MKLRSYDSLSDILGGSALFRVLIINQETSIVDIDITSQWSRMPYPYDEYNG